MIIMVDTQNHISLILLICDSPWIWQEDVFDIVSFMEFNISENMVWTVTNNNSVEEKILI